MGIVILISKKNELMKQIMSGDFSETEVSELISIEELENLYANIAQDTEWICSDINNDGVEDLLWREKGKSDIEKQIIGIFDIKNNGKCVFLDVIEKTEYYFLADNSELIYYSQYFGFYSYISYEKWVYEESWNKELTQGLYAYYIEDIDNIPYWLDAHDHSDMIENGVYFKIYEDGLTRTVNKDEFKVIFEELTKVNYEDMKENPDMFWLYQ